MGVFDTTITAGEEGVAYGTVAASLVRGFEAKADPIKRRKIFMQSVGMRAGLDTIRADRYRGIDDGGEGSFEVDLLTKGMGLLFKAMIGAPATITGPPAGYRFTSAAATPDTSLSVQVNRGYVGVGTSPETGLGGKVKTWEITQAVGGEDSFAKLKMDMDYQAVSDAVAAATATYPTDPWVYGWGECTVTVDGDDVCSWDLSIKGDNGLKVGEKCLSGNGLQHEPYRDTVAMYTGGFSSNYTDDTLYDLYKLGTVVPIVVTWTGPSADFSLTITMENCVFTGDSPVSQPGSSQITAPWICLGETGTPAVEIEYITTDVTP